MDNTQNMDCWTGRDDGPGREHTRWHSVVAPLEGADGAASTPGVSLIGFSSDEGVRRNKGRVGAAQAPDLIRGALASMAAHFEIPVRETGTVTVQGEALEEGQTELAQKVRERVGAGDAAVVLGGGHETAYGSGHGLREALPGQRIVIVNLDAHFDLRTADEPTSGTPFKQLSEEALAEGEGFEYVVFGISRPGNTRALFDEARRLGVRFHTDADLAELTVAQTRELLRSEIAGADAVHLSIDLDVLPAGVAPGVSAPAAFGVDFARIRALAEECAASGKLKLVDVVEYNPEFDVDSRTAKVAARLIDDIVCALPGSAPAL